MGLADQIEQMRQQMVAEHERVMEQVADLDRELVDSDVELMLALDGILDQQSRRAVELRRRMEIIRSRIGHVPGSPGAPEGGVKGPVASRVVARFSPPVRAESTRGDDLGLYESKAGPVS